MPKYGIALGILFVFATVNTVLLGFQLAHFSPWISQGSTNSTSFPRPTNPINSSFALFQSGSLVLAPVSWGAVLGVWMWRGRISAEWRRLGLTEDLFKLLKRMRGGGTRTSILRALATPKDRFQLAKDLNLDWTTVDYQVRVLLKYGLVTEDIAYGNVKLFKLTPIGDVILRALGEMEQRENQRMESSTSSSIELGR